MYEYRVKEIVRVVDGDTVDCNIDLGFGISSMQRVRLHGLDTPETRSKDPREKQIAQDGKQFFTSWLEENKNQLVVQTFKEDKYGRLLARFRASSGICVNDEMVKLGYAWVYSGGKKVGDISHLEALRKNSSSL
jgi:micrococcal nuclease